MTNNPYEPQPGSPFEAGPLVRVRRAEGYSFPPGPGHRFDKKHFRRQALMAYLFVGGVIFVAAYIVAGDLGWLPRGW
jgi:hypothetical protein